jgi:RHS repeat-associated protein
VTQVTLPGGEVYHFAYDANGNPTQVVMPAGASNGLAYTVDNLLASYTPPGNAPYAFSHDLNGDVTQVTLPGGRAEQYSQDNLGRLTALSYPEAAVAFSYAAGDASNQVQRVTRTPAGGGPAQQIALAHDGSLLTSATSSGVATGTYNYRYDSSFLLAGMDLVSGSDTVTTNFTHDQDGLLTGDGPFTLTRGGPAGLASGLGDGTLSVSLSYDTLGRLVRRTHSVGGRQVYDVQLTYDNVGHIVRKVEAAGGTTHTLAYAYDADGQLTQVTQDGAVVEAYAYDADGNRISRQTGTGPAETASYDAQDRILQQGGVSYHFNADGYLVQRGSDTFQYSTRGELLQATVGGQTITYAYDGLGRRVGRTDSSGTYQYLYGNPDSAFQVTAVRAPSGQLTTLYYDEAGILFALERGGARYYVAADQVGTPRVVSDATGQVVKVLDYDSFGDLRSDSNPGFDLPIGFAGGLADGATGLVRLGSRDYDPASGRWTARDPSLYDGMQPNLYAYVGNNPVNLTDPAGLFSVGASTYDGIGVGGKISITGDGFSICGEIGLGVGDALVVDPFGGLDRTGTSVVAEAIVSDGTQSIGVGGELDDRGCAMGEAKACVGPLCAKAGTEENGAEYRRSKGKELFKDALGDLELEAEAKVAAKFCGQVKW